MHAFKSGLCAALISAFALPATAETLTFELTWVNGFFLDGPEFQDPEVVPGATATLQLDSSFFPNTEYTLYDSSAVVSFEISIGYEGDTFVYTDNDVSGFLMGWTGVDLSQEITNQQGFTEFNFEPAFANICRDCDSLLDANESVVFAPPPEGIGPNTFGFLDAAYTLDTFEQVSMAPVPLPASGVMLFAGLAGVAAWRRKAQVSRAVDV